MFSFQFSRVSIRINTLKYTQRLYGSCGIVGMPNIGKSTLFNAITKTQLAEASNFPFCTIQPNHIFFNSIKKVSIPDERLEKLAKIANSEVIHRSQIEFVDIAGLVRGASKGEGLGNKFLSNIRHVDIILHSIRCFDDENISHVEQTVDPIRDLNIIKNELILGDLEIMERRMSKKMKIKMDVKTHEIHKFLINELEHGNYLYEKKYDNDICDIMKDIPLITTKPIIYLCHVNPNDCLNGNNYTKRISDYISPLNPIIISPLLEEEASQFDDDDSQLEYLQSYGLKNTGLNNIILECQKLLDLVYFFTVGPKESHSWSIRRGKKAIDAAGTIHSDFISKFVKAQTISFDDFIKYNGEEGVRRVGKIKSEGRDYIVKDGDIFNFLLR